MFANIDNQGEVRGTSDEASKFLLEIKDVSQRIHNLILFAIDGQNRKSDVIQTSFSVPASSLPEAVSKVGIGGFELLFQNQKCFSNQDLNHDDKIDLVDFSILIYRFDSTDCEADLNGDGEVDLADFYTLIGIYLKFTNAI